MYHSYSRPASPLPNPLLDRASQHRAGSEVKTDMQAPGVPSMNAGRSVNGSTSPHDRTKRGLVSPKGVARNGEASGAGERRASPAAGVEEPEAYRSTANGTSSLRAHPYPSMRRSRSPAPTTSMTYPDSRDPSPYPNRGFHRVDSEATRRENGTYGSRNQHNVSEPSQHSPSIRHAPVKRCSDCGRTEAEVGPILPMTEDGGTQVCKGCCESENMLRVTRWLTRVAFQP